MTTNRRIVYITIGAVLLSVASAGVVYYIGKKKEEKSWDDIGDNSFDFNTDGMKKEPPPPDLVIPHGNYIDDNNYPEENNDGSFDNNDESIDDSTIGVGVGAGTGGELAPPDFLTSIINFFTKSKGFEGQAEILSRGSNKGFIDKTFREMMQNSGWVSGQAWCSYFVKAFFSQFYSFDKDFINKNILANCVDTFNKLKKQNNPKWVLDETNNNPQAGDIVIWKNPNNNGSGHMGIILEVGDNYVVTLEGNYGSSNQREGDRVAKIKYSKSGFFRGTKELKIIGLLRRVFTEEEKKNIYYDEVEKTLKFK